MAPWSRAGEKCAHTKKRGKPHQSMQMKNPHLFQFYITKVMKMPTYFARCPEGRVFATELADWDKVPGYSSHNQPQLKAEWLSLHELNNN